MTRNSALRRRRRWRLPTPAAIALLAVAFATALLAPLPVAPNEARAEVLASVERRLPGWHIERAQSSWEGAWSVVATCGTSQLGFQLVPGHGLAPGEAGCIRRTATRANAWAASPTACARWSGWGSRLVSGTGRSAVARSWHASASGARPSFLAPRPID